MNIIDFYGTIILQNRLKSAVQVGRDQRVGNGWTKVESRGADGRPGISFANSRF